MAQSSNQGVATACWHQARSRFRHAAHRSRLEFARPKAQPMMIAAELRFPCQLFGAFDKL